MSRQEVLVDQRGTLLRAALLQDGQPSDFWFDRIDRPLAYGTLLDCRITRPLAEGQAAFAETAAGAPVYLRGPHIPPAGAIVTAQVKAEAGRGKLARLSTDAAFAGRALVHLPRGSGVHRSRRLGRRASRNHLSNAIEALEKLPGGWLLRSAAADLGAAELMHEAEALRAQVVQPPDGLRRDLLQCLADHANGPVRCTPSLMDQIAATCRALGLTERRVIADDGVAERLDEIADGLAAAEISLNNGARITVESTAALHAIDIDSAGSSGRRAILAALDAAIRQIRLRNLSGAILIDLPEGQSGPEDVIRHIRRAVEQDAVPLHVLGMTRLGLIELNRERRRRTLAEIMAAEAGADD